MDSANECKLTVDRLMPLVYDVLRRPASHYFLNQRRGHTLRPTALVHEVYLKLANEHTEWDAKLKFMAASASAMKRILVDHGRAQGRHKRGSHPKRVTLGETIAVNGQEAPDILDLDTVLTTLTRCDPRKGQIDELLSFGGFTYAECGAVLHISPVTLFPELTTAKAWLYSELTSAAGTA